MAFFQPPPKAKEPLDDESDSDSEAEAEESEEGVSEDRERLLAENVREVENDNNG